MTLQQLDFRKLTQALKKEHPVILWLDDERDPNAICPSFIGDDSIQDKPTWVESIVGESNPGNWDVVWVKNYKQFTNYLELAVLPDVVCFDHDLGEQASGKDCANYLVYILEERNLFGPVIRSQSANPCGVQNIYGLFDNWHSEWMKRNHVTPETLIDLISDTK
jgi:hypothetical protein